MFMWPSLLISDDHVHVLPRWLLHVPARSRAGFLTCLIVDHIVDLFVPNALMSHIANMDIKSICINGRLLDLIHNSNNAIKISSDNDNRWAEMFYPISID